MANRERHRRFGNVRKRESGRYQIRYPGPDGRMRTGPETYARKADADRALVMIEAQISVGRVDRSRPREGKTQRLRDGVDHRAAGAASPHRRPVPVATREAHRPAPRRSAGREAVHQGGPGMARRAPGQRRIRLGDGQGLPPAARRPDHRGGGRPTPPPQPVPDPRRPGGERSRTAGPDSGPGLRAGRAGRPPSGRQHSQDPERLPAPILPSRRDAHLTGGLRRHEQKPSGPCGR